MTNGPSGVSGTPGTPIPNRDLIGRTVEEIKNWKDFNRKQANLKQQLRQALRQGDLEATAEQNAIYAEYAKQKAKNDTAVLEAKLALKSFLENKRTQERIERIKQGRGNYFQSLKKDVENDFSSLKNLFSRGIQKAKDGKNSTISSIKSDINSGKNFLNKFFNNLVKEIEYTKNSFKSDVNSVTSFAKNTGNSLKSGTKNTLSSMAYDVEKVGKFVISAPKKIVKPYFDIFGDLYDGTGKLISKSTRSTKKAA